MSYSVATSIAEVRAVLEPVIAGVWIGLGYEVETICWPNTYFIKPGNGPWLRVAWPQQTTAALTWGGPGNVVQNTTIALLALQVFIPRNAGEGPLNTITDAYRAAFERKAYGAGIRFREALGPNDTAPEPEWAGRGLTLPFEYLEDIQI